MDSDKKIMISVFYTLHTFAKSEMNTDKKFKLCMLLNN